MNRTFNTLAAALALLVVAPLAAADFEDGNYIASFSSGGQSESERGESPIAGHPWEEDMPGMVMRTFFDRISTRTEGRIGWYTTQSAEESEANCDNVPTASFVYDTAAYPNPPLFVDDAFAWLPPNFFGGNDYDEEGYLVLSYYYEYNRMVSLDALGPSLAGQYQEDPTNCLYVDRDDAAGFGQGSEDHPCKTGETECRIGAEEDATIDAGVGFGVSAWQYGKGPFRHFQLNDLQQLAILQCDLVVRDPTSSDVIRPGQIDGILTTTEGGSLILTGDGLDPGLNGVDLNFAPAGAGSNACVELIDENSEWINLNSGTSGGPCNVHDCVMGNTGSIVVSEKAREWLPAAGEETRNGNSYLRPFGSTIAVVCGAMGGYYFVADEDPLNKGSPRGWAVVHQSDYDWFVFYNTDDLEMVNWGADRSHVVASPGFGGSLNQGCADFA